jgi:hypothetical protein
LWCLKESFGLISKKNSHRNFENGMTIAEIEERLDTSSVTFKEKKVLWI